MPFNISLQYNKSEKERLTKDIVTIITVSGVIKSETSVIDPVIIVKCNLSDVIKCNYMTIATFSRSYFINDIRSINDGLVEFYCHVDVLSSFAAQIRENTAIVKRQENNWNLYLNDGSFKVYQNPYVLTKAFPYGFNTQEFVLAIAGR